MTITQAECLRHAKDAHQEALRAVDPKSRKDWANIAENYRALASETIKLHSLLAGTLS